MEKKIDGKMAFRPEEIADGKMERFIKVLVENNAEIRLWTDGYVYVVEYIEDISVADGNHFEAIDGDNYIGSFSEDQEADGN